MASFFVPLTEDNIVDPHSANDRDPEKGLPSPPDMIPGLSAQREVLHRSAHLVVAAYRFEAFPNGFAFTLHVEGRGHGNGRFHFIFAPSPDMGSDQLKHPIHGPTKLDDIFRVGIEFSDGTASDLLVDLDRGGLGIHTKGCSGSDGDGWGRCVGGFWIPHLPPPGEFTIHVAWPGVGMDERSATFSADDIIEKASQALPLLNEPS